MSNDFQIKKGLLGGYKIGHACPHCSTSLTSPIDDAGNYDSCPNCNRQFVVPGKTERDRIRNEEKLAAKVKELERNQAEQPEALAELERQKQPDPPDDWLDGPPVKPKPVPETQADQAAAETRACPYCGEEILAVALKCKHCGEFLDHSLRPTPVAVASSTPPSPTTSSFFTTPAGCGCLAVLFLVLLIGIFANMDSERRTRLEDSASTEELRASLGERWTKSHTPVTS